MKKTRAVNGKKINTTEIVESAIEFVSTNGVDLEAAEKELKRQGWIAPTAAAIEMGFADETGEETIQRFAYATAIVNQIAELTGAALIDQEGKWDFTNAETIENSLNAYLTRRYKGMRQNYKK